jgi:hypothetical protein
MCAEGRPDVAHGSSRISKGSVSDAYLVRKDVGHPGYSIVTWRGRHIADPTELTTEEAHTHVVPRYLDDGEPGHPPHFMRADFDLMNAPQVAEQAYARELAALRELLRR